MVNAADCKKQAILAIQDEYFEEIQKINAEIERAASTGAFMCNVTALSSKLSLYYSYFQFRLQNFVEESTVEGLTKTQEITKIYWL